MKKNPFILYLLTTISLIISFVFFLFFLELILNYIKLNSGIKAFIAFFLLIPMGLGELAFIIFIGDYYQKRSRKNDLLGKFFIITSIQSVMFCFLELGKLLIYSPILHAYHLHFYSFWRPLNFINAAGGIIFGILFGILAYYFSKTHK